MTSSEAEAFVDRIADEMKQEKREADNDPSAGVAIVSPEGTKLGTPEEQEAENKLMDKRAAALEACGYGEAEIKRILAVTLVQKNNQRYLPKAQIVTSLPMVLFFEGRDEETLRADMCKAVRRDGGKAGPTERYRELIWQRFGAAIIPPEKKKRRKMEADIQIVTTAISSMLSESTDPEETAEQIVDLLQTGIAAGAASIAEHEGNRIQSIRRQVIAYQNEFIRRELEAAGADPEKHEGYLGIPAPAQWIGPKAD